MVPVFVDVVDDDVAVVSVLRLVVEAPDPDPPPDDDDDVDVVSVVDDLLFLLLPPLPALSRVVFVRIQVRRRDRRECV